MNIILSRIEFHHVTETGQIYKTVWYPLDERYNELFSVDIFKFLNSSFPQKEPPEWDCISRGTKTYHIPSSYHSKYFLSILLNL